MYIYMCMLHASADMLATQKASVYTHLETGYKNTGTLEGWGWGRGKEVGRGKMVFLLFQAAC